MARKIMGRDLYRSACYLADGLLIDTGSAYARRNLESALSGHTVSAIINTHAHEDHIGGNAFLQAKWNVPIYAPALAIPLLQDPASTSMHPYQKIFFGRPSPSKGVIPLGEEIESGRTKFRVIPTPGHSCDHVVFFDEQKGRLFSGDAFFGGVERVFRGTYDLREMVRSLQRLEALDPETIFTGTGAIARRPRKRIAMKREFLEEFIGKARELQAKGWTTRRIARELLPRDTTVRIITSGDFTAANLVKAALYESPH